MKLPHLLLALAALCCVAATPSKHQAFGPIKFGMSEDARERADLQLGEDMVKHGETTPGLSSVRRQFVTNGAKFQPKQTAKDALVTVTVGFPTAEIPAITARSKGHTAADYATTARTAWEVLRDVGESKFGPQKVKGEFPALNTLNGTNVPEVITDRWEFEGLVIELGISSALPRTHPKFTALVFLRATDPNATPAVAKQ